MSSEAVSHPEGGAGIALVGCKACKRCWKLKPCGPENSASSFPLQKDNRNGHQILRESPWCCDCHAAYRRGWWKKKRKQIARRLFPS